MISSILLFASCSSRAIQAPGDEGHIGGDDTQARYAVSSDPVYPTPDYVLNGTTIIVAGGGDVNGDGYVDVLMSSHNSAYGGVYLYLGTSTGFVTRSSTTFNDLYDKDQLDYTNIAFAGDLNADGYDELIISDPADERVNVYVGTAGGVSTTPAWTLAEFAGHSTSDVNDPVASVAGAGDVNGDGYDDVIVGVANYEEPGHATVYLGSSSGLRTDESAVMLDANSGVYDGFGICVSGAGDVNGDGYADVIVGALNPYVAVYYGSAAGVSEGLMTALEAGVAGVTGGGAVSGAGDVNGDGYDDVVVGVQDDQSKRSRGVVLVFNGGPSGISATPMWTREGENDTDFYGWSVAGAGDVNGDGYGDVMTGPYLTAELFLGSETGLGTAPQVTFDGGGESMSGAGDVDRDGLDDVVVAGGYVYLASTLLDSGSSDTDSDTGADTGIGSEGCQGKQGCATAPSGSVAVDVALFALGVAATRRRYPSRDR